MIVIKCKNGHTFQAMNIEFLDAEEKLHIAYYKAQGCIVENVVSIFSDKTEMDKCEECSKLEHNFDELIEEIKGE
jgi:hypothetical protein